MVFSRSSILASLVGTLYVLRPVLGHCKILNVAAKLSDPGPRSHGFAVDFSGKYPLQKNQPGDAGGDAIFYSPRVEYVANPKFPCGQLATLPNGVDIKSALSQAEALGPATTASDGSFEAQIFQVNRDGGGSCTCEYDPSATAASWSQCKTLVNPPGIQGMWPTDRTNHTAKFQMPSSTVCRGGAFKDKCIVRIRCGFKLRFGGCFVIKTPSSPSPLKLKVSGTGPTSGGQVDVESSAAQIFSTLMEKGAFSSPNSRGAKHTREVQTANNTDSIETATARLIAAKVIELMKNKNMKLNVQKATLTAKQIISKS